MRKVMLLAAVMAMVLAAAAPAFAQANAVGGSVQYVDCDQIQAAATGQYNTNNQQDLAGVAQELGVSQNQVLACFQSIAAGRNVNINTASAASAATSTATTKAGKAAMATSTATAGGGGAGGGGGGSSASAASAAGGSLPSTGGASLLALGAGALLVAGGLLARRIVR
ncbi:MAG: hypothetical protein ACJ732_10130 [Rubrobacteraceae bacterium]